MHVLSSFISLCSQYDFFAFFFLCLDFNTFYLPSFICFSSPSFLAFCSFIPFFLPSFLLLLVLSFLMFSLFSFLLVTPSVVRSFVHLLVLSFFSKFPFVHVPSLHLHLRLHLSFPSLPLLWTSKGYC